MVAPYLKYCYFPRSFFHFHFHCIFFLRHNFCLSYKIVIFTEKCPQEHRINCLTIIMEESDLPWNVLSLGNNTLHLKSYEASCVSDWLPTHLAWRGTKPIHSFSLWHDKSEVTYQISINKQLRLRTLLEASNCSPQVQCIVRSNLACLKSQISVIWSAMLLKRKSNICCAVRSVLSCSAKAVTLWKFPQSKDQNQILNLPSNLILNFPIYFFMKPKYIENDIKHIVNLVLRVSWLKLNVWPLYLGISHIKYRRFSNVTTIIAVAFRVNVSGMGLLLPLWRVGSRQWVGEWEEKAWLDDM
jgi:hypothetical protein